MVRPAHRSAVGPARQLLAAFLSAGFVGLVAWGAHPSALALLPALAVFVPLLLGCFVGEEALDRARRRRARSSSVPARRDARSSRRPRPVALVPRCTQPMARGLAVRPPPARLAHG